MRLKKWLLGFATFAAMVVICAVCAGAETYGDFEYSVLDDGTVGITGYNGSAEKVDIPAEIDGKKVTEIGRFAFENNETLTSVTIPDSVIYIRTMAFNTCTSLESVKLPGNLEVIEEASFIRCKALTSVTIPDSVTSIKGSAFYGCTSLTSVTIPDSVTSVEGDAFYGCTSLTSVTIPDSVMGIQSKAFFGCTSLKSVTIPASVVSIDGRAFGYYYDENQNYAKVDGFKINYVKNTYGHYYATKNGFSDEACFMTEEDYEGAISIQRYAGNDKTLTIPSEINGKQVVKIASGAFADSENLTSVTIPETVTDIYDYAFLNCPLLKSVTIPASTSYIGEYALGFCKDDGNYTAVDGFKINYVKNTLGHYYAIKNGFASGSCLATSTLYDGTLAITGYIGEDKSYVIPSEINGKKVTAINDNAFAGSNMLTNVTIPESITMIGDQAFINCPLLKSVTIPASVDRIDDMAFGYMVDENQNYTKVDGFKINYTKHTIGHYYAKVNGFSDEACLVTEKYEDGTVGIKAFAGDDSSITVPSEIDGKKVTQICSNAFWNNTTLTSVSLPDTIKIIGYDAFAGCTSLENITIPDSVISIGSEAFDNTAIVNNQTTPVKYVGKWVVGCDSNVKTVSLEQGTVGIAGDSFRSCEDLQSVTIPDSVKSIGGYAFEGTAVLNNQTTPVKYVDKWVVYTEDGIKTASIKEGTVGIAEYAFGFLRDLPSVKIPDNVKYICSYAFVNCTSLENVEIPDSVTSIGDLAFFGCDSLKSVTLPITVKNLGKYALGYYFNSDTFVLSKYDKFNIYCYSNSAAEKYAKDNGLAYELLKCTEHKYGDWKITKAATCTAEGTQTRTCSVCGKVETATIAKVAHKYVDTVVKPTYTAKGYTLHKCSVCGASSKDTYTAKLTLGKVTGVKLGGRAADALRINWNENTLANGYIIEMYKSGKWTRIAKIKDSSTTTYRATGLKAGTVYKFRVKAYVLYGDTPLYSDYSATVAARTNPSVMTGAKLTGRAADALRINWTKNASADGYIVEMYQGNKWVRVAKITNNSTTTFRKAGLKASSVYKFRVRAYKMSGKTALYGNYSAVVTARTNPSIVKDVKIGGKAKDALRVNWTKNTSAQGYIVEMYKGGKWVRVAKITNSNTTTFRKAGLAKNTAYKFRVKAYYMSGKTALYGNYGSVSGKTAAK